jgi:hypothetical protein
MKISGFNKLIVLFTYLSWCQELQCKNMGKSMIKILIQRAIKLENCEL